MKVKKKVEKTNKQTQKLKVLAQKRVASYAVRGNMGTQPLYKISLTEEISL